MLIQALMKRADGHFRNGELTINEMRTFLKATEFEAFANWLTEIKTFRFYDKNRNGAIDKKELKRAMIDYLNKYEEISHMFLS